MNILRLSNAGVAVTAAGSTVVVDAFNTDSVWPYLATDMDSLRRTNPDCVAFTHAHTDHFDPVMTAEYLREHPKTPVVCGEQVRRWLMSEGVGENRFLGIEAEIGGLKLALFKTRHIGPAWHDYEHYSIMIGDGEAIVTGDAIPYETNFAGRHAETLIAPFAYALSNSGFRAVRSPIGARNLIIVHMPDRANDPDGLNGKLCAGIDTSGVAVYTPLVGGCVNV